MLYTDLILKQVFSFLGMEATMFQIRNNLGVRIKYTCLTNIHNCYARVILYNGGGVEIKLMV